jgi:hypothetical protein
MVLHTALLLPVIGVAAACGDSPTGPSSPRDHEIVLSRMGVGASRGFAGFGPSYSVCGDITPSKGNTEDIVLHDLTVHVRDAAETTLFSWSVPAFSRRLGLGSSGCFGSHSDPVQGRAPGTTFLVRVTYSRVTGPSRLVEVSGPIAIDTIRPPQ